MKIDEINSPVFIGRRGETGVLSISFDVSDWLALFPLGTFSVDFKPDYLSESFSLPPTQYRVADGVLTIDIERNITGKVGRASLGVRLLVGSTVDKRSAIIPVVIAESLPPATGVMPEPVQAWIDGAVIVIGQAQTATNANEATPSLTSRNYCAKDAESDRRRDETARNDAEVIRIAAENTRNNRYETAEDDRDGLYDDAEGARDDLYGLAETARDGLYSSAEGIREVAETGRKNAEISRVNAEGIRQSDYVIAEGERDSLYSTAENARDSTFGIAEGSRVNAFNSAESGRASAEISRNSAEGIRQTAETNRIALHNKWSNPEAIATTLAPEASATAEIVIGADKVTFNLGLPEGIQGLSAYEVWEQSNAGKTEAEYIAFLKQEALAAADIANASALAAQNNLLWRKE